MSFRSLCPGNRRVKHIFIQPSSGHGDIHEAACVWWAQPVQQAKPRRPVLFPFPPLSITQYSQAAAPSLHSNLCERKRNFDILG